MGRGWDQSSRDGDRWVGNGMGIEIVEIGTSYYRRATLTSLAVSLSVYPKLDVESL